MFCHVRKYILAQLHYQHQLFVRRGFAARHARNTHDDKLDAAREWLANLDLGTIPRSICDITFSRSSGPGGQNVNKVSSKATLRIPVSSLLSLIPQPLHNTIISSRYHASKSSEIVIQSDEFRKQTDNVNSCFRKLHELIIQAGRENVPGKTSPEQMQRISMLQKAEAAQRRRIKDYQSKKKSARRGGRDDD